MENSVMKPPILRILFLLFSFSLAAVRGGAKSQAVDHHHNTTNKSEYLVNARQTRQASTPWQCPTSAASSRSSRSLAYVAFYSPRTRQDVNVYQARTGWKESDIDRVVKSGAFDLSKPTIIYTHGYTQTINRPWLREIRRLYDNLYHNRDGSEPRFNLMFYDWSDYGQRAYGTSVSYAPYLGKLLNQLINDHLTRRYNYSAGQIHIVSYSLSTHIAGQTGRKLKAANNPLGQITAIDPTGVCFHQAQSKFSEKYQLQPGDAKLVVARHYDMGNLGARRTIGGLDILVNGGSDQPSMSIGGQYTVLALMGGFGSSHVRASLHEAAPFEPDCHEMAYACRSYEAFLAGECADCGPQGNKCFQISTLGNVELGQDPVSENYKPGTKMYITTGYSQFCLHDYQVVAKLSKQASKADIEAIESGAFSAVVADDSTGEGAQVRVNPSHRARQGGEQFTQLLQLNSKVRRFNDEIRLSAGKGGRVINLKSLDSLQVNYMSHISANERRKASVRYCPKESRLLVRC